MGKSTTAEPTTGNLLLYEDAIRSVAVGCAEVGLAGGLEIAFARKREGGTRRNRPARIGRFLLPPL